MRDFIYMIWAVVMGAVAFFTGEFVTFIMLGLILISLNTISKHLSDIKGAIMKHEGKESNQ